jgi:hypothetical protein
LIGRSYNCILCQHTCTHCCIEVCSSGGIPSSTRNRERGRCFQLSTTWRVSSVMSLIYQTILILLTQLLPRYFITCQTTTLQHRSCFCECAILLYCNQPCEVAIDVIFASACGIEALTSLVYLCINSYSLSVYVCTWKLKIRHKFAEGKRLSSVSAPPSKKDEYQWVMASGLHTLRKVLSFAYACAQITCADPRDSEGYLVAESC